MSVTRDFPWPRVRADASRAWQRYAGRVRRRALPHIHALEIEGSGDRVVELLRHAADELEALGGATLVAIIYDNDLDDDLTERLTIIYEA